MAMRILGTLPTNRCFKNKKEQSCGFDGQLITFQSSQAHQDQSD
jgi:hypothetical protein